MLVLNDHLQQNISSILRTVRTIESFLKAHDELSADHTQQIAFYSAEMALLSLAASDQIDAAGDTAEKMLRHEVSSALRQMSIHFLNIQEWESAESIRAYFSTISKHCAYIQKTVELPPIEEDSVNSSEELQLVPFANRIDDEALEIISAYQGNENQADKLRGEIQALREILTSLVFERDNLLHVVCKEIEADYMRELGSIEAEIYNAECELRYLQRKMEMMQAAINRREKVKSEQINEELKAQYEEYQKAYEEFVRRIFESAEFQNRRKKKKAESKKESSQQEQDKEPPSEQREDGEEHNKDGEKKEEDSEEKQLKKLYRRIVKAMHPDLHPNQDEATKDLFKRAIQAYKDGDLKTLTEIASMIAGDNQANAENVIEELLREKARILTLIRNIRAEVHIIKTRYPYSKKQILDDPIRLAQEKAALNERLRKAKEQAERFRVRIAEMEKKYGRTDCTAE